MASQSYKCHLYVALPDQNNTRHGDAFYRFLIRQTTRTYMYCFRNFAKCASDFDWILQSRAPRGRDGEQTRPGPNFRVGAQHCSYEALDRLLDGLTSSQ